jgi:DNA adenine methylase
MKETSAKPFLKWAGGKSQLLKQFEPFFPKELKSNQITRYYEPFLGGGAVFFHIIQNFNIHNVFLSDINKDLILAYRVIQNQPGTLIRSLKRIANDYLNKYSGRKSEYFYRIRNLFNNQKCQSENTKAARLIFLNKTCYNGLFRQNSKGVFNAPHGRYKNPTIADEENILNVSRVLGKTSLKVSHFTEILKSIKANSKEAKATFIYFDPPYKPISTTSSFTAYSKFEFNDDSQQQLAKLFRDLDNLGVKVMLSNSDPKNEDPKNDFFDNLYHGYNICRKILAKRAISSNANKRGRIRELIITNY